MSWPALHESDREMFRLQAEQGLSLIPLNGKAPIEKGWQKYCQGVRIFNEQDFVGLNAGICCGPASGIMVLDIDDVSAFDTLAQANGWDGLETYTVRTGSGGLHYYFQYPTGGKGIGNRSLKHPVYNKITVFDIRGNGGQVVAAGSIHPDTGKPYLVEKDVEIAPIPGWLQVFLDGEKPATEALWHERLPSPEDREFVESLQVSQETKRLILEGEVQGGRSEAIMKVVNSLYGGNYDDKVIFFVFDHYPIGEKYDEKGDSKKSWLSSQIGKAEKYVKTKREPQSGQQDPGISLEFPRHIISGAAGDFARVYGSHLETPVEFLFMSYLTCLGTYLSRRLTMESEIQPQPRLYTLLLGQSADERKSTSISKTIDHFKEALDNFDVCWGVGSAEGLQKRIIQAPDGLLLSLDEFKQFVSKCQIQSSVLLPCVNTLFESNYYESRTKKTDIILEEAYLSLLAASTVQTYERTWDSSFTDIGFTNRIFLVPGTAKREHSFPSKVPQADKDRLAAQLKDIDRFVGGYLEMEITPEAMSMYHNWYMAVESSIHAKRIDTYALRLMSLLAINAGKTFVDEDTVRDVICLCDWQLEVRKLHDPIDADNKIARMEESIRRQLRKNPLGERRLMQQVNAHRAGLWVYETARKNLERYKEIYRGKDKRVYLRT